MAEQEPFLPGQAVDPSMIVNVFGFTESQMRDVGYITMNWGKAEYMVGWSVNLALGNASREYQDIVHSLDIIKKVRILVALMKEKRIPETCKQNVDAVAYAADNFRSGRNIFSHGSASVTETGMVVTTGKRQTISIDDLDLILLQSNYVAIASEYLPLLVQGWDGKPTLPERPRKLPPRSEIGHLLESIRTSEEP